MKPQKQRDGESIERKIGYADTVILLEDNDSFAMTAKAHIERIKRTLSVEITTNLDDFYETIGRLEERQILLVVLDKHIQNINILKPTMDFLNHKKLTYIVLSADKPTSSEIEQITKHKHCLNFFVKSSPISFTLFQLRLAIMDSLQHSLQVRRLRLERQENINSKKSQDNERLAMIATCLISVHEGVNLEDAATILESHAREAFVGDSCLAARSMIKKYDNSAD